MKNIIVMLMVLLSSTNVYAFSYFYEKNINGWSIIGENGTNKLNSSCFMETIWKDGSSFRLIKDLEDGELYILFINNQWNISDSSGSYSLRINFHYSNGVISGGSATYELLNKNTLRIRGISVDKFLQEFVSAKVMVFIMPGSINNVNIPLNNSSVGVDKLINCVRTYKTNIIKNKSKELDL